MEVQTDVVALLGMAIAGIIWLSRLEFKNTQTAKEVDLLWKKNANRDEQIDARLGGVERSLARIEGFMSIKDHQK